MLKESIGGTWSSVLKRDDACRIVPSPPRVVTISTFDGSVFEELVVYTGKLNCLCICAATLGSKMRATFS